MFGGEGDRLVGVQFEEFSSRGRGAVGFGAEGGERIGVTAEFGNQVLAEGAGKAAHQGEQHRLCNPLAQAGDQRPGMGHVDQGVAEVVVMGERAACQAPLHRGKGIAGRERTASERDGLLLILGLDGGDEGLLVPGVAALRIGIDLLAQGVVGHVADGLQEADQAVLGFVRALVVEAQPVGDTGIGVGPAELEAVVGPVNRGGHGLGGIGADLHQAGKLAGDAFVVVIAEGGFEIGHGLGLALFHRRIDDLDPDLAVAHLHGIDAQAVAVALVLAGGEIELPVVPVAGELAVAVQRPLAQGITFVRAAVVAGKDTLLGVEDGDLAPVLAEDVAALGLQILQRNRPGPALVHGNLRVDGTV